MHCAYRLKKAKIEYCCSGTVLQRPTVMLQMVEFSSVTLGFSKTVNDLCQETLAFHWLKGKSYLMNRYSSMAWGNQYRDGVIVLNRVLTQSPKHLLALSDVAVLSKVRVRNATKILDLNLNTQFILPQTLFTSCSERQHSGGEAGCKVRNVT